MRGKGFESVKVKVNGMFGILFDRFIDLSADKRPVKDKLYLNENQELIFPSENVYAFFFGEKPGGCALRFEAKQWKQYKMVGMSYVTIAPEFIPFLRNGKTIKFNGFSEGYDAEAKIKILHHKANIVKGRMIIPSPKTRPMLETPWELNFEITVFDNSLINVEKIKNWLIRGGIEISFGTYRPRFGRFTAEFKS